MSEYRLVSRISPETGQKEYGVERVYQGRDWLFRKKTKTKMLYIMTVYLGLTTKLLVVESHPNLPSCAWWDNRGEVEIAMEKFIDNRIQSKKKKELEEKFEKASEEHGVKVERYF